MGRNIDLQEREIVRELISCPRISDNQISRNTGIPLKTVNRKRKKLEEEGYLQFFTSLDTSQNGTGDFRSRQLYIVSFKNGITRYQFYERLKSVEVNSIMTKHILESHLGEKDGKLTLILVIESRVEEDVLEIFNAEITPLIKSHLGEDAISDVISINLTHNLSLLHNYIPKRNTVLGLMNTQVKKDTIFVADRIKQ